MRMIRAKTLLWLLGCAWGFMLPDHAQANDGDISYVTVKGDTLISISGRYFRKASDYRIVQQRNRIANPRALPIGKRLLIPRSILKFRSANARFYAVRGSVEIGGGRAKTGDAITEGASIVTGANSYATLALENGTRVALPSNSQVKVRFLRHYTLGDTIDYDLDVIKGGMHSRVGKARNGDDRYRARSPRAVSAVRGTEFQTRAEDGAPDYVELDEGVVDLALLSAEGLNGEGPTGQGQPLEAGKGAIFSTNGGFTIEALLPPADMIEAGKTQANPELLFHPQPKTGEVGYRYTIALDAGFLDVVQDMQAPQTLKISELDDGNYFLRVRPIASSGLQGQPATFAFKRRLNSVKASAGKADDGYVFRWEGEGAGTLRYHFQLFRDDKQSTPIIDQAGLDTARVAISDLPPGSYYWRVGSLQYIEGEVEANWTEFEKFDISQ